MTPCGLAVDARSQHREPDPFAVAIIALDNHFAKIDTDMDLNTLSFGLIRMAIQAVMEMVSGPDAGNSSSQRPPAIMAAFSS
jgi:hypothetical protein